MNQNAKLWVKNLVNGKYRKAKDALRDGNRFCCLGVACDLYSKANPKVQWDGLSFLKEKVALPRRVRIWLGLRDREGAFEESIKLRHDLRTTLAELNDNGWSFKRIADFIKKEPAGLFKK